MRTAKGIAGFHFILDAESRSAGMYTALCLMDGKKINAERMPVKNRADTAFLPEPASPSARIIPVSGIRKMRTVEASRKGDSIFLPGPGMEMNAASF